MSQSKRLSEAYEKACRLNVGQSTPVVIMSDVHRSNGSLADNFNENKQLYFAAISRYFRDGYTYIELGDGDELWENRSIENILYAHGDVFWRLAQFYKAGRLHMLYGNHDRVKQGHEVAFSGYFDEQSRSRQPLFPELTIHEAIRLQFEPDGQEIFLIHGHQGDLINDGLWKLGRFLVRYLWQPLELIGVHDPFSASGNPKLQGRLADGMADWAEKKRTLLIAGHTHRTAFSQPGEGFYFNDGCCVHPGAVTAIEIKNGELSLVKWRYMTKPDGTVFVGKHRQAGPVAISDYA